MITVRKKMPPQSAGSHHTSLCFCRFTPAHFTFSETIPLPLSMQSAKSSQLGRQCVTPLLPPRVQSQPCISNITAWERVAFSSPPWDNVTESGGPTAAVGQRSLQSDIVSDVCSDLAVCCSLYQKGPDMNCAQRSAPLPSLQRKKAACYLIHAEPSARGVATACQADLAFTVA